MGLYCATVSALETLATGCAKPCRSCSGQSAPASMSISSWKNWVCSASGRCRRSSPEMPSGPCAECFLKRLHAALQLDSVRGGSSRMPCGMYALVKATTRSQTLGGVLVCCFHLSLQKVESSSWVIFWVSSCPGMRWSEWTCMVSRSWLSMVTGRPLMDQ